MKKYTEMTMKEIDEIINRGGDDKVKLSYMVREHLGSLDLSQRARDIINASDQNGLVESFGGLLTSEEVERYISEEFGEGE